METFLAFLRGINVGGKNIIQMNDLKILFEKIAFKDVITFIQSGNVIFKSKIQDVFEIENNIEKNIKKTFDYEVKVIVKEINEFKNILDNNPFPEESLKEKERIYVTLLSQLPGKEDIEKLKKFSDNADEFKIINNVVYLLCRTGYGKTLFNNSFFEKKLDLSATTRNWETMNKIYNLGCS